MTQYTSQSHAMPHSSILLTQKTVQEVFCYFRFLHVFLSLCFTNSQYVFLKKRKKYTQKGNHEKGHVVIWTWYFYDLSRAAHYIQVCQTKISAANYHFMCKCNKGKHILALIIWEKRLKEIEIWQTKKCFLFIILAFFEIWKSIFQMRCLYALCTVGKCTAHNRNI